MIDKKQARLRRARKTRLKIAELRSLRLSVHRTNSHIYAQVFSPNGSQVLAAASSLEPEVRKNLSNGGNIGAATVIGKLIAERAKKAGIEQVALSLCPVADADQVELALEPLADSDNHVGDDRAHRAGKRI